MGRGVKWDQKSGRERDFAHARSHAMWQARVAAGEETARVELGKIVSEAKNRPCADCGTQFSSHVMQFDHVDPSTKAFNISQWSSLFPSVEILKAEIAKCEVVCANCHAERTNRRRVAVREARAIAKHLRREVVARRESSPGALEATDPPLVQ